MFPNKKKLVMYKKTWAGSRVVILMSTEVESLHTSEKYTRKGNEYLFLTLHSATFILTHSDKYH